MSENKYKKLYESVCKANEILSRHIEALKGQLNFFKTERERYELEKMRQADIIHKTLTDNNERMNAILQENDNLKTELRKLRA